MLKFILLISGVICLVGFLAMAWVISEMLKVDRQIKEERGE